MAAVLVRMRAFLTRLAPLPATVDDYASRWVPVLVLALWPVAYGLATGAAAFAWTHPGWASALEQNKVPEQPALEILAWTAAGLALVVAVHLGAIAQVRSQADVASRAGTAEVLALCRKRLRWTLGLPIAAALAWPDMENENAATVIALSALAAFAVASTAYGWSSPKSGAAPETASAPTDSAQLAAPTSAARVIPPSARLEPLARAAGPLALAILIGGFIAIFWRMTLVNYRALHPHTIDLGLYDNIVWHAAHGDWLGSSFLKGGHHNSAHFDPILIALAPLYALRPRSDTLLVLQVVWASSALVPLYLLAREKLGSAVYGLGFAAMYAAHPAVHGAALYEFHSLTLVAPLLVWLVYLLERGSYRAFALVLAVALLCREDVALVVSFMALYAILRGGKESVRAGWVTMLACAAYFLVVKRFFMDSSDLLNSGPGTYGFSYYYADLIPNGNGGKGLAVSLLTNPGFVLRNVLVRPKLEFVAALLVPLALLPLAARPARAMLVYGAIFCLLASKPAVYSIAFQYSTIVLPIAFATAIIAMEQVPRWRIVVAHGLDASRLRRALFAFALTASALVSWKLGALDPGHLFYAGFTPLARELDAAASDQYEWVVSAVAQIPPDASVAATQRLGPFVSNRRDAYDYPGAKPSDYVFVDDAETGLPDIVTRNRRVARGELEVVTRHQGLVLYRSVTPPSAAK
jgi:uncharacterized membrane protein